MTTYRSELYSLSPQILAQELYSTLNICMIYSVLLASKFLLTRSHK